MLFFSRWATNIYTQCKNQFDHSFPRPRIKTCNDRTKTLLETQLLTTRPFKRIDWQRFGQSTNSFQVKRKKQEVKRLCDRIIYYIGRLIRYSATYLWVVHVHANRGGRAARSQFLFPTPWWLLKGLPWGRGRGRKRPFEPRYPGWMTQRCCVQPAPSVPFVVVTRLRWRK